MNFTASIISGTGNGKKLGFPTLNLLMEQVPQMEEGVYACFARLGEHGIRLPAIMHYGARPTFGAHRSCEVHILDQCIDLPPHTVIVEVGDTLRNIANFGSAEQLSLQLHKDCNAARAMLCTSC